MNQQRKSKTAQDKVPEKEHENEMTQLTLVQRVERRSLEALRDYARNARIHPQEQIRLVAASITEFGFVNPVLIGPDGVIIAGHARVAAARLLGLSEIPVIVLDHLTPAQRRALVIADNQLALGATWDEELLRAELAALAEADFNLEPMGFNDEELARYLTDEDASDGLTDEDAVPELAPVPVSQTGDEWVLGNHRVLCGDATVQADVKLLMAGDQCDLVFTDPPYNVSVEGYTKDRLTIMGDNLPAEQFKEFLHQTFQSYRGVMKPGASLYVCHASSWQREFQNALEAAGFEVRCQIIWAKNTFAWGFGRYKFQHEPIFYCHVAGQRDAWYGDKSQSTLWEVNKPSANRIHPTAKPVELVERALWNSSQAGDLVVDLLGGSGATLLGCERMGRKARLMEIDRKYVDCIVQRWEQYTGKPGALQGSGRCFSEIRLERLKEAA
jgi:DNA modification methylase